MMTVRKFWGATFGVALVAFALGAVPSAFFASRAAVADVAPYLDVPLASLEHEDVTVTTTPASVLDGLSVLPSSILIQNTTSTCIRCGTEDDLSATSGIQLGDGCAGGTFRSFDVRDIVCRSESGDVDITVGFGQK